MSEGRLSSVTQDFIFGTLATDELRLEDIRKRVRGLWHGSRIDPSDPEPGDKVTLTVSAGGDISMREIGVHYTTDGSMPDSSSPALPMKVLHPRWDTLTWSYIEERSAVIPPQDDGVLVRYRVRGVAESGAEIWADEVEDSGEPGLFAYCVDRDRVPHWLREAVIYQVFVDRFAPDPGKTFNDSGSLNDFWGGTLAGLLAHMDHIAELGATAIWLTPIFPSPTHHGYDATDYTSVEPRLGTEEDLLAVVEAAHARRIRVLLDFVANHVSNQHPSFKHAMMDPSSPEREWFAFNADGSYRSFFDVETMPQLAVDRDAVANHLIDAARHWLELGVDGYRLDYANGPSLAFWSRFRRALRDTEPEVALIGEVVESADTMASYEGRLDGTLDFLLLQQLRAFLAFDLIGADEFWRFVSRHLTWFSENLSLPSFLDNHDMNRFLWVAGGDFRRLKLAALVQFSLPHPPIIYYGTEVGLSQWHDLEHADGSRRMEESRTPMLWGEQQDVDLKSFYRSLIFWRRRHGIHGIKPELVFANDSGLLILRLNAWFVVVNRSETDIVVDFREHGEVWLALATELDVQLHGSALQMTAMSGAVLRA
ncbi:MAG TPA: alpha-amylase family glycosyl hydrolase [Thermomicrobiales bacterium]|nr:alpha-amylase family glycosyl hydrolase [Thermomicrobiales bacterium]